MDEENNVQQIIDTLSEEVISGDTSDEQKKAKIAQICALAKVQNEQNRNVQDYWRFEDEMKLKRESLELESKKLQNEIKNRKIHDILDIITLASTVTVGLLELYSNRQLFHNLLIFSKDNIVTARESWKLINFKKH